jgi:peptidoglycan/LPS O-acetylase OafA/YrhL
MVASLAYDTFRRTKYFASLDALRFIAITMIVWHHTLPPGGSSWIPAVDRGFLGIDIFFLLSGFLIVTLLLREREATGDVALGRLFTRRALRLFPLYYAMLVAFLLLFLLVTPHGTLAPGFFRNLPYYLTFTSNWVVLTGFISSYWTLASQEQFYLAWPVVEKYGTRWVVPVAIGIVALSEAVNFRLTRPLELALGLDYDRLAILQTTFAPIFFGVLLAHLLHERRTFERCWRVIGQPWIPVAALAGALLAASLPVESVAGWPRLGFQVLLTLFLASTVAQPANVLAPVLRWPPVIRLGQLCYGIFLFHMVIAWGVDRGSERLGMAGSWLEFPVVYFLTYLAAELSFRYFETPFLNLKGMISGGRPAAGAAG